VLAKQFPGAAVLRSGVGEDGFDDSRCLLPDASSARGTFSAGGQVLGTLVFRVYWQG
jgi:hypothetical protein